jgi:hypothetical protein
MRLVKAPISRNPCVFAPFRCEGRNSSQAARAFVDELPREAFGVHPACWRCSMAVVARKREQAPRTPNASRGSVAAWPRCAFALDSHPPLCHLCSRWLKLIVLEAAQTTPAIRILSAGHAPWQPRPGPRVVPFLFCTEQILFTTIPQLFPNYFPIIPRHGCRFLVSFK